MLTLLLNAIVLDIQKQVKISIIAARFHISLVDYIIRVARKMEIDIIAFSGGVFQNALLVDMIYDFMGKEYHLYFQKELSPNDEGIPFGQLMYANTL